MATQRLVHAVPVSIQPQRRLKFMRASLIPGVSLQSAFGPLGRQVAERSKTLPVQAGFVPTHLIVIDQNAYITDLDARLASEGKIWERGEYSIVDIYGITRQVLVAISICGLCVWQLTGHHTFDYSDVDFPYRSAGYSHHDTESVSKLFLFPTSDDWFRNVEARTLSAVCRKLDCYYRSGTWWVDRLSVCLGHLWSGLTTMHSELAFVSFCMALESVTSTSNNEITHILAERCALLAEKSPDRRIAVYEEVKELYGIRSKIVHGRSAPRRGNITAETLAITAKLSIVPKGALHRILGVTISVIIEILRRREFLAILHERRSEDSASKALDDYYQRLLLSKRV